MKIAIVNDSDLAVNTLRQLILTVPEYDVVWIARGGRDAIDKCFRQKPDLILMDIQIPDLDGVRTTAEIMKNNPCPILIVTSSINENAGKVFEAMGNGALDAVVTPIPGAEDFLECGKEVLRKIDLIKKFSGYGEDKAALSESSENALPAYSDLPRLVIIGSSTGGPNALLKILTDLPQDPSMTIVIIQHVDEEFAGDLTEWLAELTGRSVTLARENGIPKSGKVYIAGTNDHLVINSKLQFHYTSEPRDYPYRPSVNEFFMSISRHWPQKGVAVLLTGMGRDGAKGLLALRKTGWHTIVQDQQTSIIFGMPKAAIDCGAAVETLALSLIGRAIADKFGVVL